MWGVGWELEKNGQELESFLGKWERARIKTNKKTWNLKDPTEIRNDIFVLVSATVIEMLLPTTISAA